MPVRCFTHETIDCKTPGCANAEGPIARARRLEGALVRVYELLGYPDSTNVTAALATINAALPGHPDLS